MEVLNAKCVRQGVERQLIETRTGLEGLVGKALTQQALQRLRAVLTLLSGLASPVFHVASFKAVLDCAHITTVCSQQSLWFCTCQTRGDYTKQAAGWCFHPCVDCI